MSDVMDWLAALGLVVLWLTIVIVYWLSVTVLPIVLTVWAVVFVLQSMGVIQ